MLTLNVVDLQKSTIFDLKNIARENNFKGFSKLRKNDLINFITNNYNKLNNVIIDDIKDNIIIDDIKDNVIIDDIKENDIIDDVIEDYVNEMIDMGLDDDKINFYVQEHYDKIKRIEDMNFDILPSLQKQIKINAKEHVIYNKISFDEIFDIRALCYLLDNKEKYEEIFDAQEIFEEIIDDKEKYEEIFDNMNNMNNNYSPFIICDKYFRKSKKGKINVKYHRKNNIGRLFADKSISLQNMPRIIRGTIANKYYYDVVPSFQPYYILTLRAKEVNNEKLRA